MKHAGLSVQEGFTLPAILQVKFKGGILGTEGRKLKRLYSVCRVLLPRRSAAVRICNINKKLVIDDSTLRVEFGVSQKQAYGLRETPEIKRKALDPISYRNEPRK